MNGNAPLLHGVQIINLHSFVDERGFFMETYNERTFKNSYGIDAHFVQDNHSSSKRSVLRGLHYQTIQPQGKLIRVLSGIVYDVAVDLRKSSPTFGYWMGITLHAEEKKMIWIPPGLAHGFLVLSDEADFLYKTTDYYHPQSERTLLWNDPLLGIQWPQEEAPLLSPKDRQGTLFTQADLFP